MAKGIVGNVGKARYHIKRYVELDLKYIFYNRILNFFSRIADKSNMPRFLSYLRYDNVLC